MALEFENFSRYADPGDSESYVALHRAINTFKLPPLDCYLKYQINTSPTEWDNTRLAEIKFQRELPLAWEIDSEYLFQLMETNQLEEYSAAMRAIRQTPLNLMDSAVNILTGYRNPSMPLRRVLCIDEIPDTNYSEYVLLARHLTASSVLANISKNGQLYGRELTPSEIKYLRFEAAIENSLFVTYHTPVALFKLTPGIKDGFYQSMLVETPEFLSDMPPFVQNNARHVQSLLVEVLNYYAMINS
jgi:hypothetical protein